MSWAKAWHPNTGLSGSKLVEASDRLTVQGPPPTHPLSSICILGPDLPLASSSVQDPAGQVDTFKGACGSQTSLSPSRALFACWISQQQWGQNWP